jgi:hypothetical protein
VSAGPLELELEHAIGMTAFGKLPVARQRALLVLALAVQDAERAGDRELALELCGMVIREARHAQELLR